MASFWKSGGRVVIAPFREVVCEFETRGISRGVLEVDYDELLVVVLGKEEGGWWRPRVGRLWGRGWD